MAQPHTKDISNLQDAQLNFLRRAMEVPKSTPIAALFLELGILPIQYEIEKRQLVFLKRILDRENDDQIKMSYHEMLKYQAEKNWANNVMVSTVFLWMMKMFVIWHMSCGKNGTWSGKVCGILFTNWDVLNKQKDFLLSYDKLIKAPYLSSLKPEIARMVFRARVSIYDIKENFKQKYDGKLSCPFCGQSPEQFEDIFKCNSGILCKKSLKGTTLYEFVTMKDMQKTKEIGRFLVTYQKHREIFLWGRLYF